MARRRIKLDPEPEVTTPLVGAIFGDIGTSEFRFAADEDRIKSSEYVQVYHEKHGWVLGQIVDIERDTNVSYTRAQMISSGADVSLDSRLATTVQVLGFRDERGLIQMPHTPFPAGAKVYLATSELIMDVLGLRSDVQTGAYIGLLKGHDLHVSININTLVQKHVSIIAKTGSGKSYMVGVLVEELIKRNIPVVIIDPHGEYSSMLHPNLDKNDISIMNKFGVTPRGYPNAIVQYSLDTESNLGTLQLKLDGTRLSASELIPTLGLKLTGVQVGILYQALNNVKKHHEFYTIRDLIDEVMEDPSNLKWNLVNLLEHLDSLGIFSTAPTPLRELVAPGKITLINLRGMPPDVQDIAVSQLSAKLFSARKRGRIPALMYVIEEVHNFCPQQGQAVSQTILKTLASEGRKFGLGLCVVTQRPARVDKNILSQCNTQIILKVTNPNDLKALIASVEGLNYRMTNEIQRLPVGVALVSGGALNLPVLVEIRPRETKHGGRPIEVVSPDARIAPAGEMDDTTDRKILEIKRSIAVPREERGDDWYSNLMGAYEDLIRKSEEERKTPLAPPPTLEEIDNGFRPEDLTLDDIEPTVKKRSKK